MPRILRFARRSHAPLQDNESHAFAARHSLSIYRSQSIYTFIPKNGCTTLRYSLALENGCIRGAEDFEWIHRNNWSFSAALAELLTARSTFVVLRCPYARLASFYLDKVVRGVPPATSLLPLLPLLPALVGLEALTFRQLAAATVDPAFRKSNNHVRDQIDFLVYEDYDAYFCLERFAEASVEIKRMTGLEVVDARLLSGHGLDKLSLDQSRCYADVPAGEIAAMKASGRAPDPAALFDAAVRDMVDLAYGEDVAFYERLFGESNLGCKLRSKAVEL